MISGHPILSHPFEMQIFNKKGAHEEIGRRIMLENAEIQNVLSSISPDLNQIMFELYDKDILNFKQHDESNYDVDRLDYLSRDSLYLGFSTYLPHQNYTSIPVKTDKNNIPLSNIDNTIIKDNNGNTFIDVYDFSSLQDVEKSLELREKRYSSVYFSKYTQIAEKTIGNFIEAFLSIDSNIGIKFKQFLLHFKDKDIDSVDLNEYISWDEIDLFSELLDIAQNHENPNIRDLATMIIPNTESLLNLMYSHLNIHQRNENSSYTETEKQLLQKIKHIIKSDDELSFNLRNKNYINGNTIILPEDLSIIDEKYRNLITSCSYNVSSYNKEDPIYIKDESGKIFELSNHPNRKYDWNNRKKHISLNFVNIPYLKFKGLSDLEINDLMAYSVNNNENEINEKKDVNMRPIQSHKNMEDIFLEL